MVTRQGRDVLIEDYTDALQLVDQAANRLEDASVSISSAGESFTRKSVHVIARINELSAEIQAIRNQLIEVKTDD